MTISTLGIFGFNTDESVNSAHFTRGETNIRDNFFDFELGHDSYRNL